jgi:hypothetical protein
MTWGEDLPKGDRDGLTDPPDAMPKRKPGETALAFARRICVWQRREIPPEDPPPPPSGQLRVPRSVKPYLERLDEIYGVVRKREPGQEG